MLHLFFLNILDVDDVQVPPWWIANDYSCWEMIVDRWCSQEWLEMHEAARLKRPLIREDLNVIQTSVPGG